MIQKNKGLKMRTCRGKRKNDPYFAWAKTQRIWRRRVDISLEGKTRFQCRWLYNLGYRIENAISRLRGT